MKKVCYIYRNKWSNGNKNFLFLAQTSDSMSGLVKSRLANALAQLAFGLFLLQSLHCCHAFQDAHAHPHPATLNGPSFVANAFPEKNDVLSAGNYARLSYRAVASTFAKSALQAEAESALANAPLDRLEGSFDPSHYHSAQSGDHDCCSSRSAQLNYIQPRILVAAPSRAFLDDATLALCANALFSVAETLDKRGIPLYLRLRKLLN